MQSLPEKMGKEAKYDVDLRFGTVDNLIASFRFKGPEVKKRSGKISHPVDLICDALLQPDEVKRDLEELVVKLSENGGDGFN